VDPDGLLGDEIAPQAPQQSSPTTAASPPEVGGPQTKPKPEDGPTGKPDGSGRKDEKKPGKGPWSVKDKGKGTLEVSIYLKFVGNADVSFGLEYRQPIKWKPLSKLVLERSLFIGFRISFGGRQ
jgi:hypothetical protein